MVLLGSAIGNTTSAERAALVGDIANTLKPGDRFLVTADLVKPAPVLDAAYNDPPSATAQARFRLNQLAYFSRCFDGNVVLHRFYPRARPSPSSPRRVSASASSRVLIGGRDDHASDELGAPP